MSTINRTSDIARQMLEQSGLSDAQHTLMAGNLAHHLGGVPEPYVERFEHGNPVSALPAVVNEAIVMAPPEAFRSILKLERDLDHPYTDAQVHARLRQLDTRLRDTLNEHMRLNGSYPQRMWVAGSLVRGGFGANSDADVIIDGGVGCQPVESWLAHNDIHLQYLEHDKEAEQLRFFAGATPVDPGQVVRGESVLSPLFLKSLPSAHYQVGSPL